MPDNVTLLLGPARSGKTHKLIAAYHEALAPAPAGGGLTRELWIAPNARAAAAVRERLLADGLRACFEPGVTTFDALADNILSRTTAPPRRLTPALERALLRRVIDDALRNKRLKILADAARRASFLQLLDDHFDELERRGIPPADFAKTKGMRGDAAQHRELALLYDEYAKLLAKRSLADQESRLAAAHAALAADDHGDVFAGLALVVVDGFSDFSAVQLDLLDQLALRADRAMIALPSDEARTDLFAKSAATCSELKRRHPRLKVQHFAARPSQWPAMDHLEHNLFRHPREIAAPSTDAVASLDRFQILEAAGAQDELVQLARYIKRRLLDGHDRPGDVVVVFRQLHDAAPRVPAVFGEFGIPYSLETGLPLAASGVVRALLDLLRLADEDWPFRRAVAVVTNSLLTTFERPARAATEWLLRDLQVASHRETLFTRIERLLTESPPGEPASAGGESPNEPARTHHSRQSRAAATALTPLNHLATALDALPKSASPTEWSDALAQLGRTLGIEAITKTFHDDALAHDNHLAWQHVVDHLASLERLATWLGEPPPQLTRRDVIDTLVDIAANDRLPRPHDDVGRVRVLSAATARTIEARHLILAGMTEQAFPSPERAGRLYTEADYAAFARAADQELAESDAASVRRPQEEMLLFYEVITRATERLTISYSALDEKAQTLPPSPYITELERTFAGQPISRRRIIRPSPLPPDESPLSPADWRIGAVARATLRDPPELASLAVLFTEPAMRDVANSLDAALHTIADRGRWNAFGPTEGILASEAVRARLARRFGKDHLWSPSQFEAYARCPFHFLMHDILGLEAVGELVLEADPRRRGTLLHNVLADIHRNQPELFTTCRQPTAAELERFVNEFANVVEAIARATPYSGIEAALAELDRRRIAKWAPQYFDQHTGYRGAKWPDLDEPLAPTHFEWRFGPPRFAESEDEDPRSTNEPFTLDLGDEKIRLTGRIDRIDVGRHGEYRVFNVIDYKSGKRPSLTTEKMETGERLQPALYVMAAQALLFEPHQSTPLWAGYWSMVEGVTTRAQYSLLCSEDGASPTEHWKSLQKTIIDRVREMVADIRSGQFPVYSRDDNCTSYCDFRTVCRVAQSRALKKPWPPII